MKPVEEFILASYINFYQKLIKMIPDTRLDKKFEITIIFICRDIIACYFHFVRWRELNSS